MAVQQSPAADRPTQSEPLGVRLRSRRRALALTLKEVADGAGLSVGFISQIERGLTAPSLSSLANIARVLNTPVSSFLAVPAGDRAMTRHDQRAVYGIGSNAATDPNAMTYERVSAAFPGSVLNSVIIHEPPGHRSEPIRHEGEELFYILDGAITVEVDNERTVLAAGDSIHFASTRRHSTWNHTTRPVTILHICTMDVFGDDPAMAGTPGNRAGHASAQEEAGGKDQDPKPMGDRQT